MKIGTALFVVPLDLSAAPVFLRLRKPNFCSATGIPDARTPPAGVRSRRWTRGIEILAITWLVAVTCRVAAQDTNCLECWLLVTQWHGTWNLTLTGGGLNNSSQGTFDISNGVSTVTGTGSISGNKPGCCTCTGSGSLGNLSKGQLPQFNLVLFSDPTNICTYTIFLQDPLDYTEDFHPGTVQRTAECSGLLAIPKGAGGVLPNFPLPAYGEALVESGTFTAPSPEGFGCYDGSAVTLTISWEIEPVIASGSPQFDRLPVGGSLGCNPTNTPEAATVLKGTRATAPSGQVSVSSDVVDITNGCAVTRSFTLTATDECTKKEATALVVYWWTNDTTAPLISGLPGGDLGCNPANPPTDSTVAGLITVSDDCEVASTNVTHIDTTNGCSVTRTFTITAADNCGNVSAPATGVFTWTMGTTPPVITGVPAGATYGCNPDNLPTDASVMALLQATDNCGVATKTVSHVDVNDGCTVTRTFTITAVDHCGNVSAPRTVQYTWTSDTTPPAFTYLPPGGYLGTNPPCVPGDGAVQAQCQVVDNCGVSSVKAKHVDTVTSNLVTRTFTILAKDFCGNSKGATVVYTWTGKAGVSLAPPLLNIQDIGTGVRLYWPTDADCFCLITSTGLASEVWTAVTNVPTLSGNHFMITNNASDSVRFYRLAE